MSNVARRLAVAVAFAMAATFAGGVTPDVASAQQSRSEFHDSMRKLWSDHVTWTRAYIVSIAAGLPDRDATTQRLMQNQADIGAALAPYYGDESGGKLTGLLREHMLTAGEVIAAEKSGSSVKTDSANTKWRANADEMVDFLHEANPRYWTTSGLRSMMYMHCDQTLAETEHRLKKDYAADILDFDAIEKHALMMADMISDGIIAQFPEKFSIAKKGN